MSYYQRCFILNAFEHNEVKKKEETLKVLINTKIQNDSTHVSF